MFALLSKYWWVLVVRGVMAIALGIFAIVWPQETIAALVLVFGAIALVDGTFAVVASIAGHSLTPYWWVLLLQGLLGVGVGVLTLFNPAITAVALLIYIAVWAIGMGVLQVIAAVRLLPVLTSLWICLVAAQYTWLPAAPPTESSASTSGTPAANMVASVRVQRAMVEMRTRWPNTGSLSIKRSMKI